MKKHILAFTFVLFALSFCLYGCSAAKTWTEAEFGLYDDNNNEVAVCNYDNEYFIDLSSSESQQTYRGVKIGDNAIDALNKYIQQGYAIYEYDNEECFEYDKTVNLDELLKNIDNTDNKIVFYMIFKETDGKYSPISSKVMINAADNAEELEGITYIISIIIKDEIVSDIYIMKI